jgi:putative component of toxin-antitoxin plasmid stabilization module
MLLLNSARRSGIHRYRWTKPLHEVDDRLIILLAGGMKKRQPEDIRRAKANWEDYRNRKT